MVKTLRYFLVFLLVANIFFLFSQIPFLMHIIKNPSDKVFSLMQGDWFHDYFSQVSLITEGRSGYWLKYEPYTTEPIPPSFLHIYYILVGKMAWLFQIDSFIAYHAARIISVEFYLISVFLLCFQVFKKNTALWAGILALTSGIPPFYRFREAVNLQIYPGGIPWWLVADALERLNGYPHHMIGFALLLSMTIFLFKFIHTKKLSYLFLSAIFSISGSIFFPPILAPILSCLPLAACIFGARRIVEKLLFQKKITVDKKILLGLITLFVATGCVYLYIKIQFLSGSRWMVAGNWELDRWNKIEIFFNDNLFNLFGLLSLIALPALVRNCLKGKLEEIFISLWAYFPFFILPFVDMVGLPKIRLIQVANFVPLSILTIQSLCLLDNKFRTKFILPVGITIVLLTSIPQSISLLQQRVQAYDYYASGHQYHIPKPTYSAFIYISQNIPKKSVILSGLGTGNMIPAFAPTISFIGHFVGTINYWQKQAQVNMFYSGGFTIDQTKEFLQANRIQYVFYGEEEQGISNNRVLSYSFLTPIYNSNNIIIFKVLFE